MECCYQIGVIPKITIEFSHGQTLVIENPNITLEVETQESLFTSALGEPSIVRHDIGHNVTVNAYVSEEKKEEIDAVLLRHIRGD
jgi:hypothetical protein